MGWPEQVWNQNLLEYDLEVKGDPMEVLVQQSQKKPLLQMEAGSWNTNSSARSLAKLAAFMANNGTFTGKEIIKSETWDQMHANSTDYILDQFEPTSFSQGGVNFYEAAKPATPLKWHESNNNGWVGWMGLGGSAFQWHSELKIGFCYNPFDHNLLDDRCYRASRMQKIITDIARGTYKEQKF